MKKLLLSLMAFACVFLISQLDVQAGVEFEDAIITGDEVNMRLRPSTESPIVFTFPENSRVGVYEEEKDGWYRIIYGNYIGYVSSDYVFLAYTDTITGNVIEDETAVYASAGGYGEPVAMLNAGAGVSVCGIMGDNYEVVYETDAQGNEKTGYLGKDDILTSAAKSTSLMLKENMSGIEVHNMQKELKERGFLTATATGFYGEQTKEAVKDFQEKAGIPADGIAGEQTLELVYGDNDIMTTLAEKYGIKGEIILSDWDEIENVFTKGSIATVTDVRSGIQYDVQRFGGWFHADCVPVTAEDTEKMKEANGGSWSWDRRAIWVTVDGKTYAASQNSMPHLSNPNPDDNFDGHFCIHFNDSKVHETSAECPRHQSMVQYSYSKGQEI